MSSEEESSLDIEIEALKAIYIHELEVSCDESKHSTCVKVSLHPATADNAEEQYVRLDLVLVIPPEYPDVLPEITIRNPRGLSDEKIVKIQEDLQDTAQENVGSPMLYQLIEVAKEHLTEENVPCCQCTICLYGFAEGDVFTKTQCYHYFHSHCLARYVRHALEQIAQEEADKLSPTMPSANADEDTANTKVVCPVCRLPLPPLLGLTEEEHPPPMEQQRQPAFCMTPELEQLQQSMAQLYSSPAAPRGHHQRGRREEQVPPRDICCSREQQCARSTETPFRSLQAEELETTHTAHGKRNVRERQRRAFPQVN
ncbi:E3 ubiquitin-protein ligase RNF25 [Rhipicephalus sanguineus]|uniref:E3 ubiquitin-protein ligase RNF25 n=1 Tax=Rhipicephalus sanguineus TaxID=34632 RepID=UPI00189495BF|nr:E3 ubiquitin-protein ligase RNF25 [Rhipicephalus sanguineus]